MQSTSKVALDATTIDRWSRKHLGKSLANNREITDGWFNTIHVLELADGSRAVLKVSPPPTFQPMRYERDLMATEVAVLRRLAETGLPVPRILADCPDGDGLGHAWFIMEYLEGSAWDQLRKNIPSSQCDSVDAAIARQAALVNEIRRPRFGRWSEDHCASSSWAASFLTMVDDLLADARDKNVSLPRSDTDLRKLVLAAHSELDEVKTPSLVLWDLHDGNVIVNPENLELTGFLDTDRALWGDPLMEYYFRSVAEASPAWRASFRQACIEAGITHPADTPGAAHRLDLYDLYLALVLVIESTYRGYGSEHVTWVRGLLDQALARCDGTRASQ